MNAARGRFPIDPRTAKLIQHEVLQLIESVVVKYIDEPPVAAYLTTVQKEAYKLGNYIIDQIPYASLENIEFPRLPGTGPGDDDPDPIDETERVQKYGILVNNHTGEPYVTGESDDDQEKEYGKIPVGFPVVFGEKRYPEEGFSQWRHHNGLKAIRFEYRIFEGRPIERPAHITVFYSGGDH